MHLAHAPLLVLLCLVSTPALALRCGNQLVNEGMTRYEVRKRCGDPDDSYLRYETHYRRNAHDESVAYDVEIDEWIYDFGSNRLDRRLIFINGRLFKEEILE